MNAESLKVNPILTALLGWCTEAKLWTFYKYPFAYETSHINWNNHEFYVNNLTLTCFEIYP